ncbi:MAG: hypothetical protein P4M11_08725 [Candidatus Pacebacteria bacterium]|nr:hypothetical protein [Candidatus Paceibacterota bacterium]
MNVQYVFEAIDGLFEVLSHSSQTFLPGRQTVIKSDKYCYDINWIGDLTTATSI